ncbi:PAAR domain-containing protein [Massilia yuzhufengensis]|uniref:PAAR domain-containing protein n=1 Tax=Massilia yuzhufengensis TaxID=1164594 RepID=UPI000B841D14|nr:PAAR domain-containing protein [Massilia yuzhufengensis]
MSSYRRFYINAGDRTTSDGVVSVRSNFSTVDGVSLAREGDPVECPVCDTQGVIKCVAPRLSDSFEGRQYALSDDLCICNCDPPPRLVAGQIEEFQIVSPGAETIL